MERPTQYDALEGKFPKKTECYFYTIQFLLLCPCYCVFWEEMIKSPIKNNEQKTKNYIYKKIIFYLFIHFQLLLVFVFFLLFEIIFQVPIFYTQHVLLSSTAHTVGHAGSMHFWFDFCNFCNLFLKFAF